MAGIKTAAALSVALIIFTLAYSTPFINVKSMFTENEIKATLRGEFLTSVKLSGRGEAISPGVEITSPVKNGYVYVSAADYDLAAVEKGFFHMEQSDASRKKIYRALAGIELLKGMKYFSVTENGVKELVTESWRIPSSDDYNTAGDAVPAKSVFHFAIKDNRLGVLKFRSEILSASDLFVMRNVSVATATKFGMTVFHPGDFRVFRILIYDRKLKGYFFYNAQFMKVRSDVLNRFDLIKPGSFGNRIRGEDVHFLKTLGIERPDRLAAFSN